MNTWSSFNIHEDLLLAKNALFNLCDFVCSEPVPETESADYGAFTFQLNGLSILFRVAKTTPTKVGQFVTIWKRSANGTIQPFDISDPVDLFIVSTRKNGAIGHFVFPKSILFQKRIISGNGKEGKRAIRVYPPWDNALNRQAKITQQWQSEYFIEITADTDLDLVKAKRLFLR